MSKLNRRQLIQAATNPRAKQLVNPLQGSEFAAGLESRHSDSMSRLRLVIPAAVAG